MTHGGERARTGLFGGTFNPVHLGHLRAAEEVADALDLERVIFLPSARPPHKRAQTDDVLAPARDRLAWVRLAIADNPRFAVDALEIERAGPSFSVDTLRAFAPRLAPERPVFVIGEDAFAEIGTWREPEALLALAHFAVMTRPPRRADSLAELLPPALRAAFVVEHDGGAARHRSAGTFVRRIEITALDVSSSDLRARLRAGRSVRYLLPEPAREAILRSGIYGSAGRAAGLAAHPTEAR